MRKTTMLLAFFVICPVTQLQAAVVDRNNPDYSEQSDSPVQGGFFLEIDEECGMTHSAYVQGDSALETAPKAAHGYDNIIFQCNQHFAQFTSLSQQ